MAAIKQILVGWLIDGSGGPIQDKVLLTIDNGSIVSIEPSATVDLLPDGQCIDLSYCTILPPLVDCHMHLFMSGTTDMKTREEQLDASYEEMVPVFRRHLHYLHSHGVLAARDGGDYGGYAARFKKEKQVPEGFDLKVTGKAWRNENRYGSLIGRSPVDGVSLVESYLQDTEKETIDHVKLVNSGLNSLHIFGKETAPQFSVDEIRPLVEQAKKQGKKVMVHANGKEPVRIALEAGCHSIEHGFFMGRENLALMAATGAVWVPTLFTMKAYAINADPQDPRIDVSVIQKNLEHQIQQLAQARELGVTVALGTDAGSLGVLHGEAVVEEMKLYKKAGYTLTEIIKCATVNGTDLLGVERFGLLAPGKRASFLVTRGAPSQLPRKLSYLESIYIDGKPSELYRKNPIKHM